MSEIDLETENEIENLRAALAAAQAAGAAGEQIDIVFDGPPSHQSGRFIEVEDASGRSIKFGEWVHRSDGYWVLRLRALRPPVAPAGALSKENK
jgi:hypothetical protein